MKAHVSNVNVHWQSSGYVSNRLQLREITVILSQTVNHCDHVINPHGIKDCTRAMKRESLTNTIAQQSRNLKK